PSNPASAPASNPASTGKEESSLVASSEEAKEAKLLAAYGACGYSFMTAYPAYTFKQVTFSAEKLEIYDDNSYVFRLDNKMVSGSLSFDPENTGDTESAKNNSDRGQSTTVYMGSYASSEEEGLLTITLAAPTAGYTLTTGNATMGGASLVGAKKIKGFELLIDPTTFGFDFATVEADGEDLLPIPENLKTYSSGSYDFMSAYPGYTFKQVTGKLVQVELREDKTYSYTAMGKSLSGDLVFDPENTGNSEAVANDRGATYSVYEGTYEITEEEGLETITLAAPAVGYRLVVGNNTAGQAYISGDELELPSSGATLVVDSETLSFDYVELK
ncbi:MAG: hypothetical protein IJS52_00695, partial [Bacilli bacterium]|nr:hypothetical protein [Bacilli bacterium]